jgi:molybdopterin converting factor small subunit
MSARPASSTAAVDTVSAAGGASGMTSFTAAPRSDRPGGSTTATAVAGSGLAGSAVAGSGVAGSGVATVTVRYFAAAKAASGIDEEALTVPAPTTVAAVLEAAVAEHGADLERVLERCSYLRNTIAVHGTATPLADGDALDVLPPFAGG